MLKEIVNRSRNGVVSDAQCLSQAPTSKNVSGPHSLRVPKPLGVLQQNNLLPKQTPSPKNNTRKMRQENVTSKLKTKLTSFQNIETCTNISGEQNKTSSKTRHETTHQSSPSWILSSSSRSF